MKDIMVVMILIENVLRLFDDAKGLLLVRDLRNCHVVVCVTIAIAIVGSRSGSSCCCCGVPISILSIVGSRSGSSCCGLPVALGGKDVMVTNMLIQNVLMSLLMIKDCWGKQTKTNTS